MWCGDPHDEEEPRHARAVLDDHDPACPWLSARLLLGDELEDETRLDPRDARRLIQINAALADVAERTSRRGNKRYVRYGWSNAIDVTEEAAPLVEERARILAAARRRGAGPKDA